MGNRIHFGCQALLLSTDGSTTYTALHGLQSLAINTTFNLEQVFEIGQVEIYEDIEQVPDVELTFERVLDGNALGYHLATRGFAANTLIGRSDRKCGAALAVYGDTQNSASGTPVAEVNMSGLYVSNLTYAIPVDGRATESVTLIGSNKTWKTSSFTVTGTIFDNADTPLALSSGLGGVQQRENVIFGGSTILPNGTNGIVGISSSGTNNKTNGQYAVHFQGFTISANLNRTNLLELGRREPFFRYVNLPVEVTTEIRFLSTQGDHVQAAEAGIAASGNNVTEQSIKIAMEDSTIFDMGSRNKLVSSSYGGADSNGGNALLTQSYRTFNNLTISNNSMPG